MLRYSHRQLVLLLVFVAAAGMGLAIDHWRRANPEFAERLEQLDRAPAADTRPAAGPTAPAARVPRTPKRAAPDAAPLDLNLASAAEFERLGVGTRLAARIVDARARDGPFGSVDDLRRVRGLRAATLERLRPRLAVNTP